MNSQINLNRFVFHSLNEQFHKIISITIEKQTFRTN